MRRLRESIHDLVGLGPVVRRNRVASGIELSLLRIVGASLMLVTAVYNFGYSHWSSPSSKNHPNVSLPGQYRNHITYGVIIQVHRFRVGYITGRNIPKHTSVLRSRPPVRRSVTESRCRCRHSDYGIYCFSALRLGGALTHLGVSDEWHLVFAKAV